MKFGSNLSRIAGTFIFEGRFALLYHRNSNCHSVFGLEITAIALGMIVTSLAYAQNEGNDDTLVLHYTFDYPPAFDYPYKEGKVKDHSGYGNDGQMAHTPEALREVHGRSGILRFGGEKTYIDCGDSKSLYFSGDMTFEMWVRLNGIPKSNWSLVFGDDRNFNFGFQNSQNLRLWYSGELGGMVLPVENDILSDRWAHIAVVFEYPRCRFYRNGELIRDQYMPMMGINKVRNAPKYIAGRPDSGGCPMDLDEFRVYRRALTAEQIKAHARDEEAPWVQDDELFVETHWYEKTIAVRLSCKNADYNGHMAEVTLLKGNYTDVAASQRVALTESLGESGRYVATATFALSDLKMTSVDAVVRILGPSGELVKQFNRHVSLRKPEWVHTKEGYANKVLAPWTPVEVEEKSDGTVDVRVWGRRHVFGSTLFPQKIETHGTEILASPITLNGRVNSKKIAWKDASLKIKDVKNTSTVLEQTRESDPLVLRVNTKIEYDGYMVFNCEVQARRDLSVEELTLEIPLLRRQASLCLAMDAFPENREIPMKKNYSGAVRGDLAFRFSPNIWLGDEQRGLCWQAESDQDWHYADSQSAIEILPRSKTTVFRAHWVDIPTQLAAGESLHYKFALVATPIKPILRDAWDLRIVRSDPYGEDLNLPDRKTGDGKPTLQYYAEAGVRHLFTQAHDVCPYPMPVSEGYPEALRRLVDETHAHGLRLYPYLFHQRFPVTLPEFDIHGLHMSKLPLLPWAWGGVRPPPHYPGYHSDIFTEYGAKAQGVIYHCAKSMALQDAYIHSLAQRFDQYGEDGVYLDGTGFTPACKNMRHGCGYRAQDGSVRPTYPVFSTRQFIKRIYTVIKTRRPDAVVDHHQSQGQNTASLAFGDMLWTGEHWYHLRFTGAEDGYVAGEVPLDLFRTEFMGYPIGIACETLSYRLGTRMEVSAISLLHDIPVRIRTQDKGYLEMFGKLWKVREQLGAKQAEKLFYWNNQDYVRVSPEQCHSTLLRHPKNGVLAFITNLHRDAQTVAVQFDLEKLGLSVRELDTFNVLTDERVTVAPDGVLSLPLGSMEWAYVWLRPK